MRQQWQSVLLVMTVLPALLAEPHGQAPQAIGGAGGATHAERVAVTVVDRSLSVDEPIRATVFNGLRRTIYTEDSKSDCSILLLERWSGQAWSALRACAVRRAPQRVAIDPGETRSVTLNPRSVHFQTRAPSGRLQSMVEAGTYRIKFGYRFDPAAEGVETEAVYSETFRIAP